MKYIEKREVLFGQNICKGVDMNNDDLLNLEGNKRRDFKKFLVYGAFAFLLFVIGVIGFAIYQNLSVDTNSSVVPQEKSKKDNLDLFKEINIAEDNNLNISNNSNSQNLVKVNTSKNVESNQTVQNIQKINSKQLISSTNNNIEVKSNLKNQKVVVNKEENFTSKLSNNKITNNSVSKVGVKQISKKNSNYKEYYIQVAALIKYRKPNKNFLKKINELGYNYIFYPVTIVKNGKKISVTKILIGPFKNEESLKENLLKVRKYLTPSAFIYKVK